MSSGPLANAPVDLRKAIQEKLIKAQKNLEHEISISNAVKSAVTDYRKTVFGVLVGGGAAAANPEWAQDPIKFLLVGAGALAATTVGDVFAASRKRQEGKAVNRLFSSLLVEPAVAPM